MPSDRIVYLSVDEALAIHEELISRFGGSSGVRDLGLLESALHRPRSGYYADVVEMAAAMFESLLMNHPFVHEQAQLRLTIPLAPDMRSLNVATAAAMVLGEALRQTESFPGDAANPRRP